MDDKTKNLPGKNKTNLNVEINLNKIIENKASTIKTKNWPDYPSSRTGGVLPIKLESKFSNERHRLSEFFNDKWRNWRQEYLESLKLHKSEPSPQALAVLEKQTTNIFLKIWRYPFDIIEKNVFGTFMPPDKAYAYRKRVHRYFLAYIFFSYFAYKLNFTTNNWESKQKWIMSYRKPVVYPGDHRYPLTNPRPYKEQFFDNGFSQRKVYLNGRDL